MDHPVEDDPECAIQGGHRLMPRGTEIHDGEPPVPKGEVPGMVAGGIEGREIDARVTVVAPALDVAAAPWYPRGGSLRRPVRAGAASPRRA